MKKISIVLIFAFLVIFGSSVILNPTGRLPMMIFAVLAVITYLLIARKSMVAGLLIFLLFLPFYSFVKYRIFHNSMAGVASKDIMLLLLLVAWAMNKVKSGEKINIPPWWTMILPYLLIASVNIIKAPNLMAGVLDWRIMAFYPLCSLIFFDAINTREKYYKLIRILSYAALLVAAIGIFQRVFFMKFGRWVAEDMFGSEFIRTMYEEIFITSTVGHHGVLGLYMTFSLGLLYILFTERRKMLPGWFYPVSTISYIIVIIFSNNRTAWVGLMILAIGLFIREKKRRVLFLIMAAMMIFGFFVNNQFFQKRFADIVNPMGEESSFRIRYGGWRKKLLVGLENPLGVGLGQVGMTSKSSSFGVGDKLMHYRGFSRVVDNFYFIVFIELGYPGFLFFIMFWSILFGWIMKQNRKNRHSVIFIAFLTTIIMTVSNITGVYFNFILLQMYFWFILAGAFAESNEKALPKA
ncbi:O-antigen ligase family protein [bacterium]|nr:O-antigen ligase family protein [bacterium]